LRLGFFASIAVPERGFVGGLLVTNHLGRPLEFQCTAPVRPNRTQEILYGPTLVPFLLGEVIGRTLVEKVGVKPTLLLVDELSLLDLRSHIEIPVACVELDADGKVSRAQPDSPIGPTLTIGNREVSFSAAHAADRDRIRTMAGSVPKEADLGEPFTRVREALQETLQLGAAAA
jgi:hypothetical protein